MQQILSFQLCTLFGQRSKMVHSILPHLTRWGRDKWLRQRSIFWVSTLSGGPQNDDLRKWWRSSIARLNWKKLVMSLNHLIERLDPLGIQPFHFMKRLSFARYPGLVQSRGPPKDDPSPLLDHTLVWPERAGTKRSVSLFSFDLSCAYGAL